ncbi:hypothetical protein ACH4CE_37060 [Streptomyces gelaticus]|uniref:hypothetical protein n=1 Tax=Streptomyces gelaticus TaxID=285446 RepID=UPI0037BCB227
MSVSQSFPTELSAVGPAFTDGHINPDRDPATETNLLLALTGLTPLIELSVIEPQEALTAVDQHLNRLFMTKP